MGILYGSSLPVFIIFVCGIGGLAAYATGRAIAVTWRPFWMLFWFLFLLTLAVRFLCFALFEEPLLSFQYFVVDYLVLTSIALVGWRKTRTTQMVTQYRWLYVRTSPFTWTLRQGQNDAY